MIALCQEHRLEHRTKHIALRYFLARELQQRGQLRLAYVATRANNADVFTKALPPAQPLALCLLAGDLADNTLDGRGWRYVGVSGLGLSCLCSDTSADKLSAHAIPCVFLGFPPDAPGWQFYHPTLRSQDVTFDESVPFYHLFPYRSAPPPPPPLFLSPCPPPLDPSPPQGPAPSGVSQVDPLPGIVPVEVALDSGAAQGAASGGAEPWGAEPGGTECEGTGSRASPLPAPSPYTEQIGGLTERCEPASRSASPFCTSHRVPRPRPIRVPGTYALALRPSSVPLHVPLPLPPETSLPAVPDPESDLARAASSTVSHLLATVVTDPSIESTAASSLVTGLVDLAATCRLDYAVALVAESESVSPPSIGGTYVNAVPPSGANIVDGMWIFKVKRPPGSPPAFKARSVARGFSQREGVDYFQTFFPTPKMTTLWLRRPPGFTGSFPGGTQCSLRWPIYGLRHVPRERHNTLRTTLLALGFTPSTADASLFLRTDTSLPPFYVLVYVNDLVFATADTKALTLVKSGLKKRHTCTDLGELHRYLGLQITRDRFSSPQPTPLSTGHSLSAPPSDESVEPSGPYPELVGCLMYLMTCTRPDLAYPLSLLARYVAPGRHRKVHWDAAKRLMRYLCRTSGMRLVLGGRGPVVLTGHADASWVDDSATQRSSQGYTFSLGSGSVSWRSTRSSSVFSSTCEAKIYAGAMAAHELRSLTYLLTDLGEQPRSPPVLYVDNKAMIAL
ncbi:unnamed protein product [Closterium sp. NIES-54]